MSSIVPHCQFVLVNSNETKVIPQRNCVTSETNTEASALLSVAIAAIKFFI